MVVRSQSSEIAIPLAGSVYLCGSGEKMVYRLTLLIILFAYVNSQDCEERDIRLTDDRFSTPLEGRVQVCLNGVWGTVFFYGWKEENNDVVCRQVGEKLGVDILSSVYRGTIGTVNSEYSTLPIHLVSVNCIGDEDNLLDCPYQPAGSNSNYYDVTVMCVPTDPTSPLLPNCTGEQFQCLNGFCATKNQLCNARDNCGDNSDETGCNDCVEGGIRLANGTSSRTPLAGRIEVCLGGIWGAVCNGYRDWEVENIAVACRQVGEELGVSISSSFYLGNSRSVRNDILDESGPPVHMMNVDCIGDEEALLNCSYGPVEDDQCYRHTYGVTVMCVPTDPTSPLLPNCTAEEFKCLNGYCIYEGEMCDLRNNCRDSSDETAPECTAIYNQFRQDLKDEKNLLLGLSIGVSLGIVFPILLMWLVVFGICMLVPQCPLSNLYSRKAVIGPDPARTDQERGRVPGGERGGTDERELERSNAPLFTN